MSLLVQSWRWNESSPVQIGLSSRSFRADMNRIVRQWILMDKFMLLPKELGFNTLLHDIQSET